MDGQTDEGVDEWLNTWAKWVYGRASEWVGKCTTDGGIDEWMDT